MRILVVCHKMPYPPTDGGAIASLGMIKGFAKAEDVVEVLSMQTHKHNFPLNKIPRDLTQSINWHQQWMNTRINPLSLWFNLLFSKKPYNAVRFHSKRFSNKLIELLKSNAYDIIQLEGLYVTSYIPVIRNHSRATVVLRTHNVEHEIWFRMAQHAGNGLKRWYFSVLAHRVKKMEFEALKQVDLLVPITRRDADNLPFADEENVCVSPTGIDEERIKKSSSVQNKSIFYIGALDWIPNQEALRWFLEEVWSKLQSQFPDWNFVLAGRNAPDSFINYVKQFRVDFRGEVPDAFQFIDAHQLMIVPLLSGSGMRIKILEGMARSKCIVTSSIGVEGIHATHKKNIIIADSAETFLHNISDLLTNPDQIAEIGKNACSFVAQEYNSTLLIDELRKFYAAKLNAK